MNTPLKQAAYKPAPPYDLVGLGDDIEPTSISAARVPDLSSDTPEWLTMDEVRALVRLTPSTIYRHIKAGRFPSPIKVGARSLWVKSEVLAYMHDPSGYEASPF